MTGRQRPIALVVVVAAFAGRFGVGPAGLAEVVAAVVFVALVARVVPALRRAAPELLALVAVAALLGAWVDGVGGTGVPGPWRWGAAGLVVAAAAIAASTWETDELRTIGVLIAAVAAVAALLAPSDETHLAALIGAAAVLLGGAPDRSPESPPSAPLTTGMWATAAASSAALAVVGIWFTAAHGDRPWIVAFGAMLGMSAALATWRWLRTGGRPPAGAPSGPSRGA